MNSRGFTVAELLVAAAITLAIAGALAAAAQPARDAFERVPAELDLQQRGRFALDVMSQALRTARFVTFADPDDDGAFQAMTTVVPVANAAQGVLSSDQGSPGGPLTLAVAPCPNVKEVCGFTDDSAAVIGDATQFDVFLVASTSAGARRLTPDRLLSQAYLQGATVLEIEQSAFSLAGQADGSYSLIRETAAGAVQPMVDFISSLTFAVHPDRVDMALTAHHPAGSVQRLVPERVFRTSVRRRNQP